MVRFQRQISDSNLSSQKRSDCMSLHNFSQSKAANYSYQLLLACCGKGSKKAKGKERRGEEGEERRGENRRGEQRGERREESGERREERGEKRAERREERGEEQREERRGEKRGEERREERGEPREERRCYGEAIGNVSAKLRRYAGRLRKVCRKATGSTGKGTGILREGYGEVTDKSFLNVE